MATFKVADFHLSQPTATDVKPIEAGHDKTDDKSNCSTQVSEPPDVSESAKNARLHALENRIGPTPHTTTNLLRILDAALWDIDHAEALYRDYQARKRNCRTWAGDVKTEEDADNKISMAESPDEPAGTNDVFGPTYLNGYTVDERLAMMPRLDIESPEKTLDYELVYTGNADYERREAVCIFADIVLDRHDILLSRGEAALVLGLANWNLERAVEYYQEDENIKTIRAVLYRVFDQMRVHPSSLGAADAQDERDQRLAHLLTYTGYPSWYSGQIHLTKHNDDLVKAMAGWIREGIQPIEHPKDKPGRRGEGFGRRSDWINSQILLLPVARDTHRALKGDTDLSWAVEPAAFMHPEQAAKVDISGFLKTATGSWRFPCLSNDKKAVVVKGKARPQRQGGVINYDAEPPVMGVPDWTKFRHEYIKHGRYYNKPLNDKILLADRGQNRTEEEGGTRSRFDSRTEVFDWNNKTHIENLRKWHIQKLGRATGKSLRQAGQRLSMEEKKYLKQLVDEAFEQHQLQFPNRSDEVLKSTFKICHDMKQEWERKWNARFAGKKLETDGIARRERSAGNLYTLVKRWKKLAEIYGMTFDKSGNPTDANEVGWPWEVELAEEADSNQDEETASEDEEE